MAQPSLRRPPSCTTMGPFTVMLPVSWPTPDAVTVKEL